MAPIHFKNVSKRFGDVEAIKDVSIDIPDGSFTIIVGPSGSGKTSLLRSLAGLEQISEGAILIGDRDVTRLAPKDRDVAFVFQNYALYGHLSVRDNIGFPLKARKTPKAQIAEAVEGVAERLDLGALLDRKPRALSGGQQQRVAIARALVRNPSVFLFDEPLSNLDAQLRLVMRQEIIQLQRSLGVTAVWVTHDQEEAMAMGDQILVVNKGIVEQQAPPERLYSEPANAYVARTIGSPPMNLFDGEVAAGTFACDGFSVFVGDDAPSGPVTLGIRPEDLYVADVDMPEKSTGVIDVQVELIELLGPRAIVALRAGAPITAVFSRRELSGLGGRDRVQIVAALDHVHFFAREDGRRLARAGDRQRTDALT